MNRTNKKGFTLVELLVVIAILAILATVSVVGYTAFIERANLAVDRDTADQVTHFLTAMRADSTGKYYNEPITPQNVWEVINAALEENGTLTDLVPKTEGYHYFFKFDKNEAGEYEDGKIVVAKKADIITKTAKGFFPAHAIDPATDEYGVGFFTAPDSEGNEILYFFLDTKGSSLATAINALQNIPIKGWERIEGSTTDEKIINVIQAVADAKTETNGKADYVDLLNNTRFVNKEGQIATNENANGNIIFIEENASAGDTVTVVTITNESGTPALGKSEPVPAQPLNPDDETTITVPAGAQISAGALNVATTTEGEGESATEKPVTTVTIVIETGSLSDIATSEGNPGTIEAGFTNSTKVEIKVDNDSNSYTVDDSITIIVKIDGETTTNTEHMLTLIFRNLTEKSLLIMLSRLTSINMIPERKMKTTIPSILKLSFSAVESLSQMLKTTRLILILPVKRDCSSSTL